MANFKGPSLGPRLAHNFGPHLRWKALNLSFPTNWYGESQMFA